MRNTPIASPNRVVSIAVFVLAALLLTALCLNAVLATGLASLGEPRLATKIAGWDEAPVEKGPWGEIRKFFIGEGVTAKSLLAAVATVKPGEALHAAHDHAEEEFLFITEGSGTWSVAGKEHPLRKGDVLYVEPWVPHGCTNTGKEPLAFFVARWLGKGVPAPPQPKGRTSEPKQDTKGPKGEMK